MSYSFSPTDSRNIQSWSELSKFSGRVVTCHIEGRKPFACYVYTYKNANSLTYRVSRLMKQNVPDCCPSSLPLPFSIRLASPQELNTIQNAMDASHARFECMSKEDADWAVLLSFIFYGMNEI